MRTLGERRRVEAARCCRTSSLSRTVNCEGVSDPQIRAPTWEFSGGSDGRRSRDLTIFSRALYQLSYRAVCRIESGVERLPPLLATLTGLEPATSAVTGRHANQLRYRALLVLSSSLGPRDPNGIRTRVSAVKGRRPRPLDDGAESLLRTQRRTSIRHCRACANSCHRPGPSAHGKPPPGQGNDTRGEDGFAAA